MGKLEELEEELYGKEEAGKGAKRADGRIFFPGTRSKIPTRWLENKAFARGAASPDKKFLKFFLWGLVAALLAGGVLFIFLYLGTRGQEAQIIIQGRDRIEAGEVVNIPIVVRNISRTVLREAEVAVVFPQGFLILDDQGGERPAEARFIKSIPDLAPGKEIEVDVAVRVFGREQEEKKLEAAVLYRPENLRARFTAKTSRSLVISRVALAVSWDMPESVSSGQDVDFKIHYSSSARGTFKNAALHLDYPPGFNFLSSVPAPALGDNIWDLGILEPDRQGTIAIRGTIRGEGGEVKTFLGGVGKFNALTKEWSPYSESTQATKIILPPLAIDISPETGREQAVVPGDRLAMTLRYKNNTAVVLKNVSVRVLLEGAILDLGTLSIGEGGVFSGSDGAILWGPGGTEELREIASGGEGHFEFSVLTRERPPVRSSADQNLVVRMRATIEAKTVPGELAGTRAGSEDMLELKVRSKILFSGRTLYRGSPLATSGPLPPRIGAKTSYALVFEIRNFTNNLENVEVRASLPPNVKWENVRQDDARISFDPESGQVLWKVGALKPGIGVLSPALTSAFLVSILPAEADAGKTLTLAKDVRLNASDTFTGESLELGGESLTTELRQDPASNSGDWMVAR